MFKELFAAGWEGIKTGNPVGLVAILIGIIFLGITFYLIKLFVFDIIFPHIRIVDSMNNKIRFARALLGIRVAKPDGTLMKIIDQLEEAEKKGIPINQRYKKKLKRMISKDKIVPPFMKADYYIVKTTLFPLFNFYKFRADGNLKRSIWNIDIYVDGTNVDIKYNEKFGYFEIAKDEKRKEEYEDAKVYSSIVEEKIKEVGSTVQEAIKGDFYLMKRKYRFGIPYNVDMNENETRRQ